MAKHRSLETPKPELKRPDYLLFTIVLFLSIFGIIMVFDSSIKLLSNKYHFVILQSLWVFLGVVGMIALSKIPYTSLKKIALPSMLFTIVCLIAVLFIGRTTNGALRWINVGPFQFQPSELMKPIMIIYLSSWFSKDKPFINEINDRVKYIFANEFLPFVTILIFVVSLIVIGKDLGTAIVISITALVLYFMQGTDILSTISFVSSLGLFGILGVLAILIEPYRVKRLLNFTGSGSDSLTSGYQINQILIAIGSGGWFGKGFTQSIQKQRYLVETTAATDSIFAVIAEEFGFVGSVLLLFGYAFFTLRCLRIIHKSQDSFAMLLATGITTWIVAQALLNIAVNVNLVPLTGVPLPFISYGGSSTIIMLSSIGIILNISKYINDEKSE